MHSKHSPMNLNLNQRVAIITGGATGIGKAVALGFAAEGANVAVWDLNPDAAAEQIEAGHPVHSIGMSVDVTDDSAVRSALKRTIETLGAIDHVVHAAAIGSGKFGFPFTNLQPADWTRVLQV